MSEKTDNQNTQASNAPISFWELLDKYRVVIPIIQRDYAQGREDKHKLRIEFFGQMISSLKESVHCKLDFIYACPRCNDNSDEDTESEVIYPLDGQQRLTSLWLLHWYIAFKAGVLIEGTPHYDESVCLQLKRFSYETRTSSRAFCERMCEKFVGKTTENISEYISSQPWFTRKYKEDPTVAAMLRSLSDPKEHSGFEQLLGKNVDYKTLWDRLCSASCPLKFYFRNTKKEKILNSDDLYIKMNARGKKLTDFENFKAELFSFKPNGKDELFRAENDDFISLFENAWTNYFWSLRSEDNVVDYLIMEFFNRQALNFLILHEDLDSQKSLYDHLVEHHTFSSIEIYRPILTTEFKTFYYQVWKGIIKSGKDAKESMSKPYDFDFIPIYSSKENKGYEIKYRDSIYYVSSSTIRNQVLTYAASIYFSQLSCCNQNFSSLYFNDWMMFIRNLIDNSGIDTYKKIKPLLQFISSLANQSLSIISSLKDLDIDGVKLPPQAKKQLLEETQKANKIYALRNTSKEVTSFETMIRSAEKDYPFGGAIRFLMYNGEGKVDWGDFEVKKRHLDDFFAIEHENDGVSARMLRCLYRKIDKWDDMGLPFLSSSFSSWKEILLNENLLYAIHAMLLEGVISDDKLSEFKSSFTDPIQKGTHEELVGSKFLHQTTWKDFRFKTWEHRAVVWRCSAEWKNYLLGTSRNRLICEGVRNMEIFFPDDIESDRMLGDKEHLWGVSFYFNIAGNNTSYLFYWRDSEVRRRNRSDKLIHDVYLVRRDNQKYAADNPNDLGITIDYNCSYEVFIQRLENLLDKATNM